MPTDNRMLWISLSGIRMMNSLIFYGHLKRIDYRRPIYQINNTISQRPICTKWIKQVKKFYSKRKSIELRCTIQTYLGTFKIYDLARTSSIRVQPIGGLMGGKKHMQLERKHTEHEQCSKRGQTV